MVASEAVCGIVRYFNFFACPGSGWEHNLGIKVEMYRKTSNRSPRLYYNISLLPPVFI